MRTITIPETIFFVIFNEPGFISFKFLWHHLTAFSLKWEWDYVRGFKSYQRSALERAQLDTARRNRSLFNISAEGSAVLKIMVCFHTGMHQRQRRCGRSEEHTSELQSRFDLVCRLLLEKKKVTARLF